MVSYWHDENNCSFGAIYQHNHGQLYNDALILVNIHEQNLILTVRTRRLDAVVGFGYETTCVWNEGDSELLEV